MIYVFGCSMTKWYWPTWADWLKKYSNSDVRSLAYSGYGPTNLYWNLLNNIGSMSDQDQVIMMWPHSHKNMQWYDKEWVHANDVYDFFPDSSGKMWFGEDFMGLYRTHPDKLHSLTDNIISLFRDIFNAQQLLKQKNISYKMCFTQNPWIDARPSYQPKFQTVWSDKNHITKDEILRAKRIMSLDPVQKLLEMIDWSSMIDVGSDHLDPSGYGSFWSFYLSKKEYVLYANEHDNHPTSLAHHDYCSKFLNISNDYRDLAIQCSEEAMHMPIPEFTVDDFIASPDKEMLDDKFLDILKLKDK